MNVRKIYNLLMQLHEMRDAVKGYHPTLMVNHRAFKKVKPILKKLGTPKDATFGDVQQVLDELCNCLDFAMREYR